MLTNKENKQNHEYNEYNDTKTSLNNLQGQILNNKEKSDQISRPLTEQEFRDEFEGEVFKQKDLNNCRIVATLDSFVSSGDFKILIMKNVKKGKEKGKVFYEIKLPMNTSYARTYKVFPDNQEYQIDGQSKEIVEGKMGIVALTKALSQATNAKESGGFVGDAMKMLLPPEYQVYEGTIKSDASKMRTILETFDPNTDLLVLNMGFLGKNDPSRYGNISALGNNGVSHSFSVENIMRKEGRLKVVISNPYDSSRSFVYDFDTIMEVKPDFTFATKKKWGAKEVVHQESVEKPSSSIQNVLKQTDKELKNVDIHEISKTPLSYELSSYGIDTQITLQGTNIVFTLNGKTLTIPKRNLSKIYQGKTNENYPFYLYAMQIANCLNRMKKNFIDTKKGKDNPFSYYSLTGLLFSSKDNLLPTRVLLDWSQLGISNSDDKEKFVTFLNGLK